jgi:hypothetical protein
LVQRSKEGSPRVTVHYSRLAVTENKDMDRNRWS